MSKLPIIGISIGDINSISVEVILKTLQDNRILNYCTPLVYGSPKTISFWKKQLNLAELNFHQIQTLDQLHPKKNNLKIVWDEEVDIKPGEANETGGKYAFKSLAVATKDLVDGNIHALVTGPVNKNSIVVPDRKFAGHTEYIAEECGGSPLMILASQELKVALVTGHIPINEISKQLSKEAIVSKIRLFANSLRSDFGIGKPKIAVLGLNPHAGDGGLLGKEEIELIIPAVETVQQENSCILFGPFPADGFFGAGMHHQYDGVLAMYHDQGLIPFKAAAFMDGVNITAGLPVVRTSPDHGTAFAIAGKNEANPASFRNAIYAALDILRKRNIHKEITHEPLPMTPFKRERFRIDF
jgi:4-hydroxythreonine-4-phosphate dehydrogenase